MGDSHSTHWRAALAVVAAAKRWHGVSINRNNCPFTFAITPGTGRCAGWAGSVVRWLRAHPEVRYVVVSANSGSGVVPTPGLTRRTTKISGYIRAWKALPRSVHKVFVIHDVPHSRTATRDCVTQAVARHRNAAIRCARPRVAALRQDFEADAAERTDSERVKLIDLTQFMCDDKNCFPVIGGALVIKDIGAPHPDVLNDPRTVPWPGDLAATRVTAVIQRPSFAHAWPSCSPASPSAGASSAGCASWRGARRSASPDGTRATGSMSADGAGGLPRRNQSRCCPTSNADEQCEALDVLASVAALPERKPPSTGTETRWRSSTRRSSAACCGRR